MTDMHPLTGRRVLVTGASGFIGARLCRRLASLGAHVYATFRRAMPELAEVQWVPCDLEDLDATKELFRASRPEHVVHLASHVVGHRDVEAVLPTFRSNLVSTVNLLLGSHNAGSQRVVLAGSLEEPPPGPDWSVPSSPYAAAKHAASAYGRMFHALYGLNVVNLRVFMVYGPGQRDVKKLVPYVTTSLLRGEKPKVGSGTREVDWVFVDDVVEACLSASVEPGIGGQTLDVGTGKLITVRRVVEILYEMIQPDFVPEFGALGDRPMEQVRIADVASSYERMQWQPRVGLREGLSRTIDWYRRNLE
jgi:nucleoside-diphosphate-sugar epimerase